MPGFQSCYFHLVLLVAASLATGSGAQVTPILGRSYWEQYARSELEESLRVTRNTGLAKNVIIFVGDGMGPNTITAARIYKNGETGFLSWERFPHVGALKTYAEDKQVTDSAASGTSLFCGVKTNYNVLGLSAKVKKEDCQAAQDPDAKLTHLTTHFQKDGRSTGIVTTARVTHATPAALYAHSAHRDWECHVPENIPAGGLCKDIARQMVEDLPARDFNVILGGGRNTLQSDFPYVEDPEEETCQRKDGRDLIQQWTNDKISRHRTSRVVYDTASLMSVGNSVDYLLGVFAGSHMKYHFERDTKSTGTPSLQNMTTAALKILMKNKKGFFLMVEAEHVDLAHHKGWARKSLNEVVSLDNAISATMNMLDEAGIKDDTLVIVTSDHSHTLSISGYQPRGNNILGMAENVDKNNVPYTTLMYANGRGYNYSVANGSVARQNPAQMNTTDWEYRPLAAVPLTKESHGGSDVFVYASGPYAHLFHHMHEQNYVAEVVKFAAKVGEYSNQKMKVTADSGESSTGRIISPSSFITVTLLITTMFFKKFMNL